MTDRLAEQLTDDFVTQHERLGAAVTAIITDYMAGLDSRKVASSASPKDLQKIFDEPLPEQGIAFDEILKRITDDVLPHAMQVAVRGITVSSIPRPYPLAFGPTP